MSTGYMWNGSAWRQLSSGWVWNGSQWRQITTGWMWNGSQWRQIFSSGTFQPEIRDVSGNIIDTRAVNNLLYGYRGSNTSATYSYTWQYGRGEDYESNWATQTGAGATGTLTGSTLTTTYQTTSTDVTRLESALYNYLLYMRFRVTRSGETQDSNVVRIHKRVALQNFQTVLGYRSFDLYVTEFNWSTRNPYSGDLLTFWSSGDWSNTLEITNDRRPDYYIFTYTLDGEITVKDSRDEDPSDPRTPTNASRFQVPFGSSYLGKPVFYEIEAHTSSPSSPTVKTGQTRNVDDGTLKAPTNLLLQYNTNLYPSKLYMTWDPSDGGNNNTLTYTWFLYKDNVFFSFGTVTGGIGTGLFALYPSSGTLSIEGTYKFEVSASQNGQTTVTSTFSNEVVVEAPSAFTYSISNRTTIDGIPGDFTIFSFAQNTTISNRIELDWSDSTNANEYESAWFRPDGTSSSNPVTTSSDYWGYAESGTYTSIITARNEQTQFVRFSWTKPAGTSANSYRIVYRQTTFGSSFNTTVDVGDVTNYDLTFSNQYTTNVQIISITAYSDTTAGTGISRIGTASGSTTLSQSQLQEVATRQKQRSEFVTYIIASVGTLEVTGNAEPGQSLNYIYSGTWTPSISDPGWTFTRTWGITRTAVGLPDTYTRGTAASVTPLAGDIGENLIIRVVATWKDQTPSFNTVRAYSEIVVPAPPAFTLTNNFNQTFTISNVSSSGGGFYFGTYTGGSVSETSISSSFTSPVLSLGSKSVTLFGRAKKSIEGFTEIFDGRRSTTNSVNVTDLGDFTWSMNDQTSAPSQPGTIAVTFTDSRVDLNWPDVAGAERYFSQIFSSAGASANSNYRSVSDDYWPVTNGGFSVSGDVTSVNQNGVVRVTGLNSAGAQSYRVTYRVGATTYTSDTTASSVDISLPSLVDQFGTTFEVLSVRAYRNIDWTGAQKIGSYSGGGTTGSITVFQAQSAPKAWSGTTASQPGIPTGFSGTADGTTINLQWFADANSINYGIIRTTSSTFVPTSTSSPSITTPGNTVGSLRTFPDTGRATSTTYYYFIRGQNSLLNSGWSSRIQVTVPAPAAPGLPTGVSVSPSGLVTWGAPFSGGTVTSYDVQHQRASSSTGTSPSTVVTTNVGTATSYQIPAISGKIWARARVRANGPGGSSAYTPSGYTAWS